MPPTLSDFTPEPLTNGFASGRHGLCAIPCYRDSRSRARRIIDPKVLTSVLSDHEHAIVHCVMSIFTSRLSLLSTALTG